MKESISYTYLLNMMLVFISVSFCVLLAVFSYSKAFRVNSKIINILEESEGYNDLAKSEINKVITNFGYQIMNINCKSKMNAELRENKNGSCIYEFKEEINSEKYIYYGVQTYIVFDFPVLKWLLRIPVYNTTEKIYFFEDGSDVT